MNSSEIKKPESTFLCRSLLRLALIAFVLTLCALGYWDSFLRRPVGNGPVGIPLLVDAGEEVWSERPVLLLGLGDSITAGFGSSPGKDHFNLIAKSREGDFSDINGVCLSKFLPNLVTLNKAVSGSTSLELVSVSLPRLELADDVFGIVLITTGGNDVIHDYGRGIPREGAMYGATYEQCESWFKNYEERLQHVYDEVNLKFPAGCEIFIANVYDPTDGLANTTEVGMPYWRDGLRIHSRYNEIIEASTKSRGNVHFVDIQTPFLGHGINCRKFWAKHYSWSDPHYWYYTNFEDPNDRGYDALRRTYLNVIVPVVKAKLSQ